MDGARRKKDRKPVSKSSPSREKDLQLQFPVRYRHVIRWGVTNITAEAETMAKKKICRRVFPDDRAIGLDYTLNLSGLYCNMNNEDFLLAY